MARHALAYVEDGVPALARGEFLRQRANMADTHRLMAESGQRQADGGDSDLRVELGAVLLAHSLGEVISPEIVCHPDAHFSPTVMAGLDPAVQPTARVRRTSLLSPG